MTCVKVELTRQNQKAGVTLFAMNKITQTMQFRQAVIEYSNKYGVTAAAIRYRLNRQYIYRWRKRYDGTLQSLADRSHRPHHHPNQHTPEEIKLILNMRRRNPNTGIVVLWVKLRQKGYTRSISGLYRFLRKRGAMAVKLPNPKYIPKPYEQMQYPGQRVQIDVKFVPKACIVNQQESTQWFQYTFLDEYSRFRYIEAFQEHSTYSSTAFLRHVVKKFPYLIECVQTDNGTEFTNRLLPKGSDKPTLFELELKKLGIRHKLIRPYTHVTMAKWSAATVKITKNSMLLTVSIALMISKPSLLSVNGLTTISPCVLSLGALLSRSYSLPLICNTSLTNLHF